MARPHSRHHHHHYHNHLHQQKGAPSPLSDAGFAGNSWSKYEKGAGETRDFVAEIMSHPDLLSQMKSDRLHPRPASPIRQLIAPVRQEASGDLRKMLVNVTVVGSVGPLRLLMHANATMDEVIKQALQEYRHQGRLPTLECDTGCFNLCCAIDTSKALASNLQIRGLGVRQFVLCPRSDYSTETNARNARQQDAAVGEHWKKKWANFVGFLSSHLLMGTLLNLLNADSRHGEPIALPLKLRSSS